MLHPCNIHRVARQCGIKLYDASENRTTGRKPGTCFCKPTLREIGQFYGEAHLALCLRLINETGNGLELHSTTIKAVSMVLETELVVVGADLFAKFDKINLGRLRLVCRCVGRPTAPAMAAALLVLLDSNSFVTREAA